MINLFEKLSNDKNVKVIAVKLVGDEERSFRLDGCKLSINAEKTLITFTSPLRKVVINPTYIERVSIS